MLDARGGRAAQLNAGARVASGDVLLFLHADSRLPVDAYASLAEAWRTPAVAGGNFALRFDGGGAFERVLGAVYRLQRRHGYYYGDSSVWVRRETFEALGGYREIPIMDDYDFVRRLERGPGRTRCLPGPATTSSRRWRAMGIPRTVLAWFVIRWLYVAGVSPAGSRGCTGSCAERACSVRAPHERHPAAACTPPRRAPPAAARRARSRRGSPTARRSPASPSWRAPCTR